MNFDLFNFFFDDDLWEVLEYVYLKKYVEFFEGGLFYECLERGENFRFVKYEYNYIEM